MDLFVLKKIKEGDIKAFESIFRLYYTPLCLYATSITGELEVAEEIVQELDPDYEPIDGDGCSILGKVVALIRRY